MMMVKLTARQRSQLPTCYYEGYLTKRSFKDKTSRKLWTCLCGNTLFFFNEKRNTEYIEKVDLRGFVSITDDSSQDRNLDAARFNLQLKEENIRFTALNLEARELWKGYIRSVVELAVPASINLLPGQIQTLKETVEKEEARINNASPPVVTNNAAPVSLQGDKPACYHNVTRLEAELLLEREAVRGNMLLRPGSAGSSFAVTTRQHLEGSIIRHYRVTPKHTGGFLIDVDNPVLCATLHDVIHYLVEKSDGVLTPLIFEETYEKNISFISKDCENGESSLQQALTSLGPPSAPPKKVEEKEKEMDSLSAAPLQRKTSSHKHIYKCLFLTCYNFWSSTELHKKAPKKAIMPPVPAPRRLLPSPSSTNGDQKMRVVTEPQGQIPLAAMSELKLKFGQISRC
uniref:Signal transducing adaptor family member 2b n=1 Tax=Gasterosteus aculeatus aculeatus TaxID=481459 RepID=G3PMY0_GASAC|nr:signal-transducing adaptor protein 1-like isoform X1 [Gasterosteus aculeatus aculeatus]